MARVLDRIGGGIYRGARYVATAVGLERNRWGSKFLAELNIMGERLSRIFILRNMPFRIDGHLLYLAGRSAPSISFSTEVISQRYEQETSKILRELLKPGMTVLDIGAHVGCHTLLAARLVGPAGKVYAFEAAPENYALLQKNVALNGYKNVVPIPKAVADKMGSITFHLSPEGNDRNSIYDNSRTGKHGKEVEVPTTTIDDFVGLEDWPKIDLVKIDVEGAEPLVLRGMTELLQRSQDLIVILEFAPACLRESGHNPAGVLSFLAEHKFDIEILDGVNVPRRLQCSEFKAFTHEVEGEGMKNLLCRQRQFGTASQADGA